MESLLDLFCDVVDFCQSFLPVWRKQLLNASEIQRQRERSLSLSEIMTILIHFHQSHDRHFKAYYTQGKLSHRMLTPSNVEDRKPVPQLARRLFGKMFGDKGYLSKALRDELFRTFSVEPVTPVRSNMKNMLMPLMDKILLWKRAIVETIIDQLKNISQMEHSRPRSPVNFLVNLLCGLIADCR